MTRDPARATAHTHRLFFALWPGDDVRGALARAVDHVHAFRHAGRRVAPGKYHLTLHFLGGWTAQPDDAIGQARTVGGSLASRGFHLVVQRAGSFRDARVGWLAPAGNSGLDALWAELRRGLDDAGLPRRAHERFAPHVTVLRDLRAAVAEAGVPAVSWPVEDVVLVHSHSGRYDIVGRWPLAAG